MTKRIIWSGEHKNSVRAVAEKKDGLFYVEMWQRPIFGCRYVKTGDRQLKWAFKAAEAAMRSR